MMKILENARGTIKFYDILNELKNPKDGSPKFEKAELMFFLHEESIKDKRFFLIDDYVVDWFFNNNLAQGGFLFQYLKTHLNELV